MTVRISTTLHRRHTEPSRKILRMPVESEVDEPLAMADDSDGRSWRRAWGVSYVLPSRRSGPSTDVQARKWSLIVSAHLKRGHSRLVRLAPLLELVRMLPRRVERIVEQRLTALRLRRFLLGRRQLAERSARTRDRPRTSAPSRPRPWPQRARRGTAGGQLAVGASGSGATHAGGHGDDTVRAVARGARVARAGALVDNANSAERGGRRAGVVAEVRQVVRRRGHGRGDASGTKSRRVQSTVCARLCASDSESSHGQCRAMGASRATKRTN